MPISLADGLLRGLAVYLLAGGLLLPWSYTRAWPAAAPGARGASWGFQLLALPGTILLWPLLWLRARHPARPDGDDPARLRTAQSVLIALAATTVLIAIIVSLTTRTPLPTMPELPAVSVTAP